MPDENGVLTEAEKEKIRKWLDEKGKGEIICPISKDSKWVIGDTAVALLNIAQEEVLFGGDVYPQIVLICETCGHTLLINAVMIGVFPPKGETNAGK